MQLGLECRWLGAVQLARTTTFLAREYILPDGQRIRLSAERFQAAEVLFQPGALGHESAGLSEAVYECITELPIDNRRDMYGTILLGGGTMMLRGLSTRLQRDLESMYLHRVLQVPFCSLMFSRGRLESHHLLSSVP
jgi:actin-related protein